ncbi:type III-B CRISPR module-associated protein Cmr5 [Candidatus Sordicultor fermentans]|uniref:type III-B CRISPR module-associated protein Cmr5 n=1 Tax=Candidatus Sordicultor fermentans TaxID=1953203 RepID=UPI002C1BCAD8|nr:type III-B CRISPR module-associated protein Cmr5 [Atribacterota bacterium]HOA84205.1 type III-B CRISPR module-associated protein Cmr5 [Thermodesulfovibrio thiophilus]
MAEKKTIMSKLEGGRAEFAYNCALEACEKSNKLKKDYRSYARKIPQMIFTNGLGQAMAFVCSKKKSNKEKEDAYDLIYRQISSYMESPCVSGIQKPSGEDLTGWVVSLNSYQYRYVEEEILAFLNWLRRFAEGLIEEGEE